MHPSQSVRSLTLPAPAYPDAPLLRLADIGPPSAPPLLMLHGYTDSAYSFAPVVPHLVPQWRLLIPDQRGHGDSDRPFGSYSPAQLAQDAFSLLDLLSIRQATVVGHAMGSFVAQHMAVQQPERVNALMLIGSARFPANETIRQLRFAVEAAGDRIPLEFIRAFQQSSVRHPLPDDFLANLVEESAKLPPLLWRQVLSEMIDSGPVTGLEKIRCPVMVAGGTDDPVFLPEEQMELARAFPRATLCLESGIGHALHWEAPESFVRLLQSAIPWNRAA